MDGTSRGDDRRTTTGRTVDDQVVDATDLVHDRAPDAVPDVVPEQAVRTSDDLGRDVGETKRGCERCRCGDDRSGFSR